MRTAPRNHLASCSPEFVRDTAFLLAKMHASASLDVVRQAEEGPELWRVNGTLAVVPLHRARP